MGFVAAGFIMYFLFKKDGEPAAAALYGDSFAAFWNGRGFMKGRREIVGVSDICYTPK